MKKDLEKILLFVFTVGGKFKVKINIEKGGVIIFHETFIDFQIRYRFCTYKLKNKVKLIKAEFNFKGHF